VLRKLSEVVNVVPVIAKSDSLTLEERSAFKERVSLVSGFMASPDSSNRTSLIVSPVVYFLQMISFGLQGRFTQDADVP
jgi:hypothetical protein